MLDRSERYSRQLVLEGFGAEAQEKLNKGRVLVVGVGGLGTAAALYLAASGIGTIGLMDDDFVSLNNLNRQILHWSNDIGRPKTESAQEKLGAFNPGITIQPLNQRFGETSGSGLLEQYDFVLDCLDNLETRLMLNEACVKHHRPFAHGGAIKFSGQITTVIPGQSPCLRCFLPSDPEGCHGTCERVGVLGPIVGIIGVLQALEAVKYLAGLGDLLTGRLLLFDGLAGSFDEINIERDPQCPVCGNVVGGSHGQPE
ncbi:MAG: HesA/MoeB/ThiF family protein [Acidobacteriota bacterium]